MNNGTVSPGQTKRNQIIAYLLPAILIFNFVWRMFTTANEYPGRTATIMEMVFDVLLVAGLFGIKAKIPSPLFWAALICGIGVLGVRLHGDASWWTGHWNYSVR